MENQVKKIKSYTGPKIAELTDFKAEETADGTLEFSGYANTKYVADRYGDVPAEYNRSFVYDISEFLKNPIMLLDHNGSVKSVAGSYVVVREDERGLFVKGQMTKSDLPEMKHARTLIKEGHLKTLSIGGRFLYENPENLSQLTLAKIYEISIVAVPADPNAIFKPDEKEAPKAEVKQETTEVKEIVEEKPAEVQELNFAPLADKITLFEIKQKLKKARILSGEERK